MSRCILSAEAESDIRGLFERIKVDSESAATRIIADIDAAFELLAGMPDIGHTRADLSGQAVRFWPVRKRYLVIYRATPDGIVVTRVLDGRRDVPNILRDA